MGSLKVSVGAAFMSGLKLFMRSMDSWVNVLSQENPAQQVSPT